MFNTEHGPLAEVLARIENRTSYGEVASGRSHLSQSDQRVHFGLGQATRVERLEVRWANGAAVAYPIEGVDRLVVIDQAKGVVSPR